METALHTTVVRNVLVLVAHRRETAVLQAAEHLRERHGARITIVDLSLTGDDLVAAGTRLAGECDAGLVVVAEAGMRTQRLLRRTDRSLLVVPATEAGSADGSMLALVDFSPESLKAAQWATEVAAAEGRDVELLHAFPIEWDSPPVARERAEREMAAFVPRLGPSRATVAPRVVMASVGGYVAESVLAEIAKGKYVAVFAGGRRRTALGRLLFASVTERIVLGAGLPVWVVRG
jgi:nucleotide-binding universal stress UspA family protein